MSLEVVSPDRPELDGRSWRLPAFTEADRRSGRFVFVLPGEQLDDRFRPGDLPAALLDLHVVVRSTAYPGGEVSGRLVPAPNRAPEAPTLLAPDDGQTLLLAGDGSTPVTIRWRPVGDPNADQPTYLVQFAADDAFTRLLGSDLRLGETYETTYGALSRMLGAAGVPPGEEGTVYVRVAATDGGAVSVGEARALRLTHGALTATEGGELPERFALHGNYPNPFNPVTTVVFDLPWPAAVSAEVYDVLGRRVLALPVRAVPAGAGRPLRVDAASLASGVYLYRVTARSAEATRHETGRMVVLK